MYTYVSSLLSLSLTTLYPNPVHHPSAPTQAPSICFTLGNVYTSMLLSQFFPPFPTPFVEGTILSPLYIFLHLYRQSVDLICTGSFWGSLFCFIDSMSAIMLVSYSSDYHSFVIYFEIKTWLALFFILKIDLTICYPSWLHMNF